MLTFDSLTPQTLGRTIEEVAATVHNAMMAPKDAEAGSSVTNNFEWLRDSHYNWTREEIRSHVTNSYINRKLIDIALYSVNEWAHKVITPKECTKFRAEMRRLFQIDLDKVLDAGTAIPQYEIDEAIALLKKAGYIVFQLPDDQYINGIVEAHFPDTKLCEGEHESVRIELQDVDTMSYNLQEWTINAIENTLDTREQDADFEEEVH